MSSCRLVTGAKESAGKRAGTSGTTLGPASRTWAFSEAAVLCVRATPAGQQALARCANKPGKGQALTVCTPTLARAVSDRLPREVVCDLPTFCQREGRRGGAPAASRGHEGRSLVPVRYQAALLASPNAPAPRGALPCPCAFAWTPALAPGPRAQGPAGAGALPRPRTGHALVPRARQPHLCVGRDEGTALFRGRRASSASSRHSPARWRETLNTCVVQPQARCARREPSRQHTLPEDDGASTTAAKSTPSALRGRWSLDNGGPHKC